MRLDRLRQMRNFSRRNPVKEGVFYIEVTGTLTVLHRSPAFVLLRDAAMFNDAADLSDIGYTRFPGRVRVSNIEYERDSMDPGRIGSRVTVHFTLMH